MTRLLCVLTFVTLLFPALASAQGAVIVVRHAERIDNSVDSALSPAGEARAQRLSQMLKDAAIDRIFTTVLQRTVQTATPTAAQFRLTPTQLLGSDLDGLIAQVRASKPTDTVLIVGHSNTVPAIVQRLGVTAPVTVADDDFGNVFVVVPREGTPPQLIRLRY